MPLASLMTASLPGKLVVLVGVPARRERRRAAGHAGAGTSLRSLRLSRLLETIEGLTGGIGQDRDRLSVDRRSCAADGNCWVCVPDPPPLLLVAPLSLGQEHGCESSFRWCTSLRAGLNVYPKTMGSDTLGSYAQGNPFVSLLACRSV